MSIEIDKWLSRCLAERQITSTDVAAMAKQKRIRLAQPTVHRVASGETRNPGIRTLYDIARAIDEPLFSDSVLGASDPTLERAIASIREAWKDGDDDIRDALLLAIPIMVGMANKRRAHSTEHADSKPPITKAGTKSGIVRLVHDKNPQKK